MARYVFAPEVVLREGPSTTYNSATDPAALLFGDAPFGVYSDRSGGTDYSGDLTALDGVTPLTPLTDSSGQTPWLRGPDGVKTLYYDAGAGTRFPCYAVDVLDSAAALDVDQTWTGAQTFTGQVDYALTPTVNGAPLGTGGGGGGVALTSYVNQVATLADYPAAIAAGSSQALARAAIGAGTSSLSIGTTSTTAKAGNYTPTATEVNAVAPAPQIYWNNTTSAWAGPPRSTWGATVVVAYKASLYVGATMPTGVYTPLVGDEFYLHANSTLRPA